MKNATIFTALVLFSFLPFGCSEDEVWRNTEKALIVDNSLVLEKPNDLKLKLETDLKLQKRVMAIGAEIKMALNPELEASKMIGREILRSRGVDPDLAFGDPNDSRLAMVPIMSALLDSINREWNKQGIQLDSVAWIDQEDTPQQTSNGHTVSITENSKRIGNTIMDCFANEAGKVLSIFGTAYGFAAAGKVAGSVVVSALGGSLTAGQAIGALGLAYWAYRSGQCAGDKLLRNHPEDCSITLPLPCEDVIAMGPEAFKGYWGFSDDHPYNKCVRDLNLQLPWENRNLAKRVR